MALYVALIPAVVGLVVGLTAWINAEAALTRAKIHEQAHHVANSWVAPHTHPGPPSTGQ